MKVAGLRKVSLIDYPGRVAASIFMAGCNLRCGYCHNRWMLDENQVQEALSVQDLVSWLETRRGLLDGVCVSGGEPTIHPEIVDLLRTIKDLGFVTKIDTNGTLPDRLGRLLETGCVDYVAMDIKAPLDERYGLVSGRPVDPDSIRKSMALLRAWGSSYEFRTTVAPALDEAALWEIARQVRAEEAWFLQLFVASPQVDPVVAQQDCLDASALRNLVGQLGSLVPKVSLRADI